MLRALLDATVGRRLLLRIWLHGVLLFAGVIGIVTASHFILSRMDAAMAARTHPEFALGLAERALALVDDPDALARELHHVREATSVELTVFAPDDHPIATAALPPLAPASAAERTLVVANRTARNGDRIVVGTRRGDAVVAYAVAVVPGAPSTPLHVVVLLTGALVLALLVVALPLTRSIARPLEQLRGFARQLGDGDLGVRAPTLRRDEIGDLARAFNNMATQIQRLRTAERELLGDVSHELRTPLARMRVVLDLASDADPERVRRYLREIATDLTELDQLLDDIITSSRLDRPERWDHAQPPLRRRELGLGELVDATTRRFEERWPERVLTCPASTPDLVIDADPVLLRRALDNLVDNARKYSPVDTPITLSVERTELDGTPAARIEVADRGFGIATDDQPRVFTAFFRADRSRARDTGGVGLGLALARRIIEAHGGRIGFSSEIDRGSTFWFVLPLAAPTKFVPHR